MNAAFWLVTTAWIAGADTAPSAAPRAAAPAPAAPVAAYSGCSGCGGDCGGCGGGCVESCCGHESWWSRLRGRMHRHSCCESCCETACAPACESCGCGNAHWGGHGCGGCDTCGCGHSGGLLGRLRGRHHHGCCAEECCGTSCGDCGGCSGYGSAAPVAVPATPAKPKGESIPAPKPKEMPRGEVMQPVPSINPALENAPKGGLTVETEIKNP